MSEQIENERRFLVETIPGVAAWPVPFEVSTIHQTYLIPTTPGTVERVRQRRWRKGNRILCVHNIKTPQPTGGPLEKEVPVSMEVYKDLLNRADPERVTLWKARMVFDYAGWTWELDEIFTRHLNILEVELPSLDTEVELPPWLKIMREITGESALSNYELAKPLPH